MQRWIRIMPEDRKIRIINKLGLHVRPAARLSEIANRYKSQITILQDNKKINAKSIIELLTLGASEGTLLTFQADGQDATAALDEIEKLIMAKFNEE